MSDRARDYQEGRAAGLELALRIVREGGVEALEEEIRFRGRLNINFGVEKKVVEKATESLKALCIQTVRIAFFSVLHDEFGFGKTRLRRASIAFDKLTAYLIHGWLHWLDLIEEITKRLDMELDTTQITEGNLGICYAHPNAEDVYEEEDLVDIEAWRRILKHTGYSEKKAEGKKDTFILIDDQGQQCFEYEGSFERIGMYDFLCGVEYEQEKAKQARENMSA